MYAKLRKLWPFVKWTFFLLLAFFIGRLFYRDLTRPELWEYVWVHGIHAGWLVLAGVLYLLWFAGSTTYWRALLASFGLRPPLLAAVRAYYIGQLGKYIPGKAMALLLRANLIFPFGVGRGMASLTAFYEVLTTMATGALLALVLLAVFGTDTTQPVTWDSIVQTVNLEEVPTGSVVDRKILVGLCAFFLCGYGGPILPPVFNRVVHYVSLPFRDRDTPTPRFRLTVLLQGVGLTLLGWLFLGGSLLAVVHAVCAPELAWPAEAEMAGRVIGVMAVAWFAGFVVLNAPGGLGAREYLIVLFLTPELLAATDNQTDKAHTLAVLVAIVMRLVSVAAELLASACLYWLPLKPVAGAAPPEAGELDNPTGETP
jgi:uncharacterized membrane protein YbhN (UPF0104 family)